jgi:hypothetical protein
MLGQTLRKLAATHVALLQRTTRIRRLWLLPALKRSTPRAVRIRANRAGVQRPEVGCFPRKE